MIDFLSENKPHGQTPAKFTFNLIIKIITHVSKNRDAIFFIVERNRGDTSMGNNVSYTTQKKMLLKCI